MGMIILDLGYGKIMTLKRTVKIIPIAKKNCTNELAEIKFMTAGFWKLGKFWVRYFRDWSGRVQFLD
jgi:hypothetical protein